MKIEHILPADIERRSMEIIEDELGDIILPPDEKDIIKRVVHTSADFDYVRNLRFSPWRRQSGLDGPERRLHHCDRYQHGLHGYQPAGPEKNWAAAKSASWPMKT